MHTTPASSPFTPTPPPSPSAVRAQRTPTSSTSRPSKPCDFKQIARQLTPSNRQKPYACIPLCGKSTDEIQTPSNDYAHEIQTYIRYLPFFQHAYLVHTSTLNRYHYFIVWLADLAAAGKLQDDAFNTILPETELERFLHASSIEQELACLGDAYKKDYRRICKMLEDNESVWNHHFYQWFIDSKTPCSIISWHTLYPEMPNNCSPDVFLHTLGLHTHYRSKFQQRMDESIEKYYTIDGKNHTNPKGHLYHQSFPYQSELTVTAKNNKQHKQSVLKTLSLKHNRISSLFVNDFIHRNVAFIDTKNPILLMSAHLNMYLRTLFHNAHQLQSHSILCVNPSNHTPHDLPNFFDPMDKSMPPATQETIARIHALHAKSLNNASMQLTHALRQHSPTLTEQAIENIVTMLLALGNHNASTQHHLTSAMIHHVRCVLPSTPKTASPNHSSHAQSGSIYVITNHDRYSPSAHTDVSRSHDMQAHPNPYPSFFNHTAAPRPKKNTPLHHKIRAAWHSQRPTTAYTACVFITRLSLFFTNRLQITTPQPTTKHPTTA